MTNKPVTIRLKTPRHPNGRHVVVVTTSIDGLPVKVIGQGENLTEARAAANLEVNRAAAKIRGKSADTDGSFQMSF